MLLGDTAIVTPAEAARLRVAVLLTVLPILLVTTTEKSARLSEAAVGGVVYEEDVAPLIAAPFFCHWYPSGDVPLTATEKVAVCPVATVWLTGCVVMDGATAALPTLLTSPAHPVRQTPPSKTARRRSPNFRVREEFLAANIWLRQFQ